MLIFTQNQARSHKKKRFWAQIYFEAEAQGDLEMAYYEWRVDSEKFVRLASLT